MSPSRPAYYAALVLGGFLIFSYFWHARLGYVSAPGGDLYNHYHHLVQLREEGIGSFFSGYPRLFHALVLLGMQLTGSDALRVMLALLPLTVAAAGLSAYLFLRCLVGQWPGFLALWLAIFVAKQPLQTLYDGGFPNYLNVAVFFPLVLWGMAELPAAKRRGALLIGAGTLLMLLTHHFSVTYLIILAVCAVGTTEWRKTPGLVLGSLLACVVIILSPLGKGFRDQVGGVIRFGGEFPGIHLVGGLDNPNALIPYTAFPDYFGGVIFWGGVITAVLVLVQWWRKRPVPSVLVCLSGLTLLLLLTSQVKALQFPLRLARDAGVPLYLLTAYGLSVLVQQVKNRRSRYGLIAAFCLLLLPSTLARLQRLARFEPTMQYTPAQEKLAQVIGASPALAVNQLLPSVPHPNIQPVLLEGETTAGSLKGALEGKDYVLLEEGGPEFASIQAVLLENGFQLLQTERDPLKTVWLYGR